MGFFDDLESALDGFENLVNHAADSLERGAAAVEKSVDTAEQKITRSADIVDHHSKMIAERADRVTKTSEKLLRRDYQRHSITVRKVDPLDDAPDRMAT